MDLNSFLNNLMTIFAIVLNIVLGIMGLRTRSSIVAATTQAFSSSVEKAIMGDGNRGGSASVNSPVNASSSGHSTDNNNPNAQRTANAAIAGGAAGGAAGALEASGGAQDAKGAFQDNTNQDHGKVGSQNLDSEDGEAESEKQSQVDASADDMAEPVAVGGAGVSKGEFEEAAPASAKVSGSATQQASSTRGLDASKNGEKDYGKVGTPLAQVAARQAEQQSKQPNQGGQSQQGTGASPLRSVQASQENRSKEPVSGTTQTQAQQGAPEGSQPTQAQGAAQMSSNASISTKGAQPNRDARDDSAPRAADVASKEATPMRAVATSDGATTEATSSGDVQGKVQGQGSQPKGASKAVSSPDVSTKTDVGGSHSASAKESAYKDEPTKNPDVKASVDGSSKAGDQDRSTADDKEKKGARSASDSDRKGAKSMQDPSDSRERHAAQMETDGKRRPQRLAGKAEPKKAQTPNGIAAKKGAAPSSAQEHEQASRVAGAAAAQQGVPNIISKTSNSQTNNMRATPHFQATRMQNIGVNKAGNGMRPQQMKRKYLDGSFNHNHQFHGEMPQLQPNGKIARADVGGAGYDAYRDTVDSDTASDAEAAAGAYEDDGNLHF